MIFTIPNFLSPEELHRIGEILQQAEFVDGKLTAGWYAYTLDPRNLGDSGDLLDKIHPQR
ncbi:hypothetical protein [Baaleninema simplex]|uniref:hypothetical protein n=1 Tax=Baaleninema simplex TaxID=2862350 RepID=UPI0003449C87|nr:hypothetical protein [Baaleninema simplex]